MGHKVDGRWIFYAKLNNIFFLNFIFLLLSVCLLLLLAGSFTVAGFCDTTLKTSSGLHCRHSLPSPAWLTKWRLPGGNIMVPKFAALCHLLCVVVVVTTLQLMRYFMAIMYHLKWLNFQPQCLHLRNQLLEISIPNSRYTASFIFNGTPMLPSQCWRIEFYFQFIHVRTPIRYSIFQLWCLS